MADVYKNMIQSYYLIWSYTNTLEYSNDILDIFMKNKQIMLNTDNSEEFCI